MHWAITSNFTKYNWGIFLSAFFMWKKGFRKKVQPLRFEGVKIYSFFFHYKKLESLNRWSQQSPLNSEFFYCINFMLQKCGQIFLYFEQPPFCLQNKWFRTYPAMHFIVNSKWNGTSELMIGHKVDSTSKTFTSNQLSLHSISSQSQFVCHKFPLICFLHCPV